MPKLIARLLPRIIKEPLEIQYNRLKHFGFNRYCPACKSCVKKFLPYGVKIREDAICPICGLSERHRALWVLLKKELKIKENKNIKILHFAPEKKLTKLFKSIKKSQYLSADLSKKTAMVNFDITQIPYPKSSFDFIYCSHVLEHVPDDNQALKEISRVMTKGGKAIILVPIRRDITYEDFSITDPKEREIAFGQHDHVRVYGNDFRDKLKKVGLDYKEYYPDDYLSEKQIIRYGLHGYNIQRQPIFICTKADEDNLQQIES